MRKQDLDHVIVHGPIGLTESRVERGFACIWKRMINGRAVFKENWQSCQWPLKAAPLRSKFFPRDSRDSPFPRRKRMALTSP
jgi:hypothetical protein